ncbi:hypothetical protein KXV85_004479, partial [Aspergillus fumigatus]
AGLAGPHQDVAAQHRERAANPRRGPGAPQSRDRHRPRRRPAGERAGQPEGAGAPAAPDARPECQRARRAGVATAGKRARARRLPEQHRDPARDTRPAVGAADPATGHPAAGGAARLGNGQCRQCPRAVLPDHSAHRQWRLSELGAGLAVPAACGVLPAGRQRHAADLRRWPHPRQFRIRQGA